MRRKATARIFPYETVGWWLRQIPNDDEKSKAIRNLVMLSPRASGFAPADSIDEAICTAFGWGSTPEGSAYWAALADKYSDDVEEEEEYYSDDAEEEEHEDDDDDEDTDPDITYSFNYEPS